MTLDSVVDRFFVHESTGDIRSGLESPLADTSGSSLTPFNAFEVIVDKDRQTVTVIDVLEHDSMHELATT